MLSVAAVSIGSWVVETGLRSMKHSDGVQGMHISEFIWNFTHDTESHGIFWECFIILFRYWYLRHMRRDLSAKPLAVHFLSYKRKSREITRIQQMIRLLLKHHLPSWRILPRFSPRTTCRRPPRPHSSLTWRLHRRSCHPVKPAPELSELGQWYYSHCRAAFQWTWWERLKTFLGRYGGGGGCQSMKQSSNARLCNGDGLPGFIPRDEWRWWLVLSVAQSHSGVM